MVVRRDDVRNALSGGIKGSESNFVVELREFRKEAKYAIDQTFPKRPRTFVAFVEYTCAFNLTMHANLSGTTYFQRISSI